MNTHVIDAAVDRLTDRIRKCEDRLAALEEEAGEKKVVVEVREPRTVSLAGILGDMLSKLTQEELEEIFK